ncbi:Rrg8 [Kluyveromyces lactis]|nr:Rrg8 [Kluyveromyces lactis]
MSKDWRKLFVSRGDGTKNFLKKTFTVPEVQSPLLTNFHRWAGKERVLKLTDKEQVAETVGNSSWNLSKNLFANLLASPMRSDKASRFKFPRDLLIQMKLVQTGNENPGKLATLVPLIHMKNGNSSSYVANSLKIFKGKKPGLGQLVPTAVNDSGIANISLSDIVLDKSLFTEKHQEELLQCIENCMKQLVDQRKSSVPVVVEDWDVVLTYDHSNDNDIEVVRLKKLPKEPTVIILNLKVVENDSIKDLVNDKLKNHEVGVVLKFLKDERLIRLVYSLLNFSK